MKRVRHHPVFGDEGDIWSVEDFIYRICKNSFMSKFLRIQFDKSLISFDELLEILGLDNKCDYELVDW